MNGSGQGFQFTDLIILALVAGFLILRLRAVLGQRTGDEKPFDHSSLGQWGDVGQSNNAGRGETGQDQAGAPGTVSESAVAPAKPGVIVELPPDATGVDAELARIGGLDPSFDKEHFLAGARKAFEVILEAFAKGDLKTLRPLLADAVYRNFEAAIRDRNKRGEALETEIGGFNTIDIVDAGVENRTARIVVRFVSEQTVAVRDAENRVIDGDPTGTEQVTDEWTFARDLGSSDPNWRLVATATPEPAT